MDEMSKHSRIGVAALRSGMHRNTARKYVEAGKPPSQLRRPRTWRTREDPFAKDWEDVAGRLEEAPELEAKALFEDLVRRRPARYQEGQLRTFQRRVKQWRAEWDKIFQDPMTTACAIDRLVHHAIILELSGKSYRAEAAESRARKKPAQ